MHDDVEKIQEMLLRALEAYFGSDEKRIAHAKKVLQYARVLLAREQADPYVVIPAAILHDVGIKAAEEKYHSSAARYQEQEGPAIAGRMLVDMDYDEASTYEICAIIAHHHTPGPQETTNFKVLYDADWLVNLADEMDTSDPVKLQEAIDTIFLTATGRQMAEEIFIKHA